METCKRLYNVVECIRKGNHEKAQEHFKFYVSNRVKNILSEDYDELNENMVSASTFTDIPDLYDVSDMIDRIQIFIEHEPSLSKEYEQMVDKLTVGAKHGKHEKHYVKLWYSLLEKGIPLFLRKYHPDSDINDITKKIIKPIADELTVGYMRDIRDDLRYAKERKRQRYR